MNATYSIAIRTLGLSGEKFIAELDSIKKQTIKPEKVIIYIAKGYRRPSYSIGIEEYVEVKKGMAAQRALDYNEISSKYILLLDDDVELSPNSAEILLETLEQEKADCVAANTFHNEKMKLLEKFKAIMTSWAFPRFYDNKWAFKIHSCGNFSYNNNPTKNYYLSQSAAGPASMWKKQSLLNIRFKDELWLDNLGFAYGDDLVFFYKLYRNNGKLLVHYNSGINHLDAQSARVLEYNDNKIRKLKLRATMIFLLWWRIRFCNAKTNIFYTSFTIILFTIRCVWEFILHTCYSIGIMNINPIKFYFLGLCEGIKVINNKDYKKISKFIIRISE